MRRGHGDRYAERRRSHGVAARKGVLVERPQRVDETIVGVTGTRPRNAAATAYSHPFPARVTPRAISVRRRRRACSTKRSTMRSSSSWSRAMGFDARVERYTANIVAGDVRRVVRRACSSRKSFVTPCKAPTSRDLYPLRRRSASAPATNGVMRNAARQWEPAAPAERFDGGRVKGTMVRAHIDWV